MNISNFSFSSFDDIAIEPVDVTTTNLVLKPLSLLAANPLNLLRLLLATMLEEIAAMCNAVQVCDATAAGTCAKAGTIKILLFATGY